MGNRLTHESSRNVTEEDYEDLDMGIPGLLAVLMMLFGYIKPAKSTPLQPVCDIRVLDNYIREAKNAANTAKQCEETCALAGNFTLPKTSVSYREWAAKDMGTKAKEVQGGLKLLAAAVQKVQNMTVSGNMLYVIERSYSNIRSIAQMVKSFAPVFVNGEQPPVQTTFNSRTVRTIFHVYLNFLQGKVRLFFLDTEACNLATS
ncbi:erythropoietin-like isoform X1 [Hypanus sabinus]|uniref:erythropoietin-like isoform X1 n=1 Tax=Hypanus sabinus TaxID=79690 RepID=UPI0028C3C100|nr:erythropoietin-like isoform X1 [Hypanus sabinus]